MDYEADEFVVHANRPAKEVMQILNAPLVREFTPFEKKIAPVVKAVGRCYVISIWTLLALSAAGIVALPK